MEALPQYTNNQTKSYGAAPTSSAPAAPDTEPLLPPSGPSSSSTANRNAWMDEGSPEDDVPEDFKIGVAVADCDTVIRLAFVRKVYAILFAQLLLTAVVAACMSLPAAVQFTQSNPWVIWIPLIGSLVSLFGVYWKRHDFPANLITLGLFTVFEALMVGLVTSYTESRIVVQAVFITLGVFTGLTLFTFQTKFDFSSFGPFLFAGIWGLITTSLVAVFLPFNETLDLGIACFSVVLFSGFILYDTQQIMKRLNVDEAILGSLSLYLDMLNLFLSILRILNNQNRD